MCARDGRGTIEVCFSEKGALAKKSLGNTDLHITTAVGGPFEISEVRGPLKEECVTVTLGPFESKVGQLYIAVAVGPL